MKSDPEKALQDAEVRKAAEEEIEDFVWRRVEPEVMDALLRSPPEHGQVIELWPPR